MVRDSGGMQLASPGPTLGVIGGGQLGRMMGESAAPLGVDVIVVDPTPRAPAWPVVSEQIVAPFDDRDALLEVAERSDVLTFEIELADPHLLEEVREATGTPVHPDPKTLGLIEDKLVQKTRLRDAGVPVPPFERVDTLDEVHEALDEFGTPAMLKARRDAYDGRGNVLIRDRSDAEQAFEAVGGDAMLEAFVDYDRELAVMGCKGQGERDAFPVTETIHEEEILRESVTPARTSKAMLEKAREVAFDVLDMMQGRGVFGIEMFEADGEILLNEIAPRPHNSGHWTIEGAGVSQFEQHVRAVLGLPLGSTELVAPTVTANLLADGDRERPARLEGVEKILSTNRASLHWYGKRKARPLRKMGHVTLRGPQNADRDALLATARELEDAVTFA